VCCIFEKTCGGGSIAENCTYFSSSGLSVGAPCILSICKSSSDVCQLRLDFETFVLSNPVTATATTLGTDGAAGAANRVGNCETDLFSITNPGGKSPPAICGVNTGQHLYIPASSQCNDLSAHIGSASSANSASFTIKVTQVECDSKTLAPSGCLQYFTTNSGTIESFNYNSAGGVLLANQDYSACVRAGRTYCAICYYTAATITGFKMSLPNAISAITNADTNCGSPGVSAPLTAGGAYDHIVIPGGQCDSPVANAVVATIITDRYCGTDLNCVTAVPNTQATTATVCTNQKPFKISVHSDGVEYNNPAAAGESALGSAGFSILYYMKTTCLTRPDA
jgi:hypothetical protein